MQIILVHSKLKQARTLHLSRRHAFYVVLALIFAWFVGSGALYYVSFRVASALHLPFLQKVIESVAADTTRRQEQRMSDSLNAMAVRLGDLQAQIARLEVLGERISGKVGLKPQEFGFGQPPGRGGLMVSESSKEITLKEFEHDLDRVSQQLQIRSDSMQKLESALTLRQTANGMTPSNQPVEEGFIGSGFGWRHDPFTGRTAMHEGLDFAAAVGTPINAAAGGVVVAAQYHPMFGNMVEIDHGNELTTRYAHASKLHVKLGDIVKRGQYIADVGSTGRSTGAHLHFEVRVKGDPKDPAKFLAAGQMLPAIAPSPSPVIAQTHSSIKPTP